MIFKTYRNAFLQTTEKSLITGDFLVQYDTFFAMNYKWPVSTMLLLNNTLKQTHYVAWKLWNAFCSDYQSFDVPFPSGL